MKHLSILLVLPLFLFAFTQDMAQYRKIKNDAFQKGEHIEYHVHYGLITIGEAEIDVSKKNYLVNDRICYKIDVVGRTTNLVGMVSKVEDVWRSYLDTAALMPHRFYRNIKEGNYRRKELTSFDQIQKKAVLKFEEFSATEADKKKTGTKNFDVPQYVQDMVSGYYYLRTLDFDNMKPNQRVNIPGVLEDQLYNMDIIYIGKETIKTKFGSMVAHKMQPIMPKTDLFRGENPISFWVSDDLNRVPVLVEAEMFLGKIAIELKAHKNLKHKLKVK